VSTVKKSVAKMLRAWARTKSRHVRKYLPHRARFALDRNVPHCGFSRSPGARLGPGPRGQLEDGPGADGDTASAVPPVAGASAAASLAARRTLTIADGPIVGRL
jgi:hypothetical protein